MYYESFFFLVKNVFNLYSNLTITIYNRRIFFMDLNLTLSSYFDFDAIFNKTKKKKI